MNSLAPDPARPSVDHSDLPLPDFDHVLIGHLPSRIASLDEASVAQLIAYEQQHGHRLPVLRVLENRVEALHQGAPPSDSELASGMPESAIGPNRGSKVSPATAGPPIDPAVNSILTNPTQR
ncbi:hypothetical protein SAMN05216282_1376 [Cryobacterium psychrotolerans]|uniref:DUF8129 domain-containing protein n=1 Tax=Cryobacterium psychrotolerans TaxID=386301 RepID=A0A1G9HTC3_9MICO|nr:MULTISPECIES: hypothetical protein [Cryobacterium]TFD47304.1 hypothetical protein E3T33_03240 [Cryobacterium sp. TMT1-2-1]TFD88654.1 hypothetical protein E3T56_04200 [Cryobacterium psychrotolerans]SDL15974.1 hypothetical protein SAMN05216282_1376 [Cryobacterium psychrotolerans]